MASGVLRKQALKLDSLTGYEITDSQGEEEVKNRTYESIWAMGEGQM